MTEADSHLSRRAVIKGASLGVGISLMGPAPVEPAPAPIWSGEYRARKGDVSLYLFRKRQGAPTAGAPPRPVLFLVHGSSISARPSFDLAVQIVARETGQARFHFYGGSSGALRAGAFAMARPERVDRLILEAFTWTGKGSPTLGKRAEGLEYFRTHNRRPRGRDMIRSIFTRDKPGTSDPAVAEALADAELPFGDTIPTGTYLDMTANLPVVDPAKVKSPVLLVRGEHDGIATEEDLLEFYRRLPNPDRQFVILAGASHAVALGHTRNQLWHVMRAFLEMPGRLDGKA